MVSKNGLFKKTNKKKKKEEKLEMNMLLVLNMSS